MGASNPMGREHVVVALGQPPTDFASPQERLDYAAGAARAAGGLGDALLVLPELFLSGYGDSLADPAAAASRDRGTLERIRVLASRERIWLVTGLVMRASGGFANGCVVIDPFGRLVATYSKIHLFGDAERAAFCPGNSVPIVPTPLGNTAVAICFDIEQAEFIAFLRQRGADAVLVPTANMAPYHEVPDVHVRARALENELLIAYANYAGPDRDLDLLGDSVVVGPDGAVLARAGPGPAMIAAYVSRAPDVDQRPVSAENRYLALGTAPAVTP